MKILIVDDETHVLKALRYFLNEEEIPIDEIREATNGIEAIESITKSVPDLIFSDMQMPGMNGSQLLSWIKEHHPSIKIIAVSSYSHFNYMRNVIQAGGLDYLLKPIDPKQLHSALEKAIKEMKKASKTTEQNIKVNMYSPIYRAKVLSDTIAHKDCPHIDLHSISQELSIPTPMSLIIIKLPQHNTIAKEIFNTDVNLLFFSINNICNEILTKQRGYAFTYLYKDNETVLLYWGKNHTLTNDLHKIREWIFKLTGSMPYIAIGDEFHKIEQLAYGYDTAELAYLQRPIFSNAHSTIFNYRPEKVPKIDLKPLLERCYQDWFIAIRTYNQTILVNTSTYIYQYLQTQSSFTFGHLQNFLLLFQHYYDLLVEAFHIEQNDSVYIECDLNTLDSIDEVIQYLNKKLGQLLTCYGQQNKKISLTEQVTEYIAKNYNKNLSLSNIARNFYVSKEHLAREFKKMTGSTLSTYVTTLRLEKASMLLRSTNHPIKEIAEQLGYQDEKYFSKVFKRFYNISPLFYRTSK